MTDNDAETAKADVSPNDIAAKRRWLLANNDMRLEKSELATYKNYKGFNEVTMRFVITL